MDELYEKVIAKFKQMSALDLEERLAAASADPIAMLAKLVTDAEETPIQWFSAILKPPHISALK